MADLVVSYITESGYLDDNISVYSEYEEFDYVMLFSDYPESLTMFASLCCLIFMLIGIPGNLITIVALAKCKKVRNATAVFIMNLSCSDLLFCCFNLPLAGSTFWRRAWTHGRTLCRMFPFARYSLVAVSLFTVLAITINRYIMISHPRLYPKLYKRSYLGVMVFTIWLSSFGALLPTWLGLWGTFGLDPQVGSCSILPDASGKSPKEFLFVVAFALPCLAIIVCYARIFAIVHDAAKKSRGLRRETYRPSEDSALGSVSTAAEKSPLPSALILPRKDNGIHLSIPQAVTPAQERSSSSGVDTLDGNEEPIEFCKSETSKRLRNAAAALRRASEPFGNTRPRLTAKDKRLLKMILVIAVSFFVCYLPITVTKITKDFTSQPVANIAGYVLIYLTTCINPIIYVVMSNEYRQAYKNLLMCRKKS